MTFPSVYNTSFLYVLVLVVSVATCSSQVIASCTNDTTLAFSVDYRRMLHVICEIVGRKGLTLRNC